MAIVHGSKANGGLNTFLSFIVYFCNEYAPQFESWMVPGKGNEPRIEAKRNLEQACRNVEG